MGAENVLTFFDISTWGSNIAHPQPAIVQQPANTAADCSGSIPMKEVVLKQNRRRVHLCVS